VLSSLWGSGINTRSSLLPLLFVLTDAFHVEGLFLQDCTYASHKLLKLGPLFPKLLNLLVVSEVCLVGLGQSSSTLVITLFRSSIIKTN